MKYKTKPKRKKSSPRQEQDFYGYLQDPNKNPFYKK